MLFIIRAPRAALRRDRRGATRSPRIFFELGAQSCWGPSQRRRWRRGVRERRCIPGAAAAATSDISLAGGPVGFFDEGEAGRETKAKKVHERGKPAGSLLAADVSGRALEHLPPLVVPFPAHALPTLATALRSLGNR
ncbi:hypothetical protein MRX96_029432 [Rhipicephalus microplus]